MELPANLDDMPIEQLTKLALDQRTSTLNELLKHPALHARVSEHRKVLTRELAAQAMPEGVKTLASLARSSEDLGKSTNAYKLLHTIAGYDQEEAKQADKAVLIIDLGDRTIEINANPEPIEGQATPVPEEPFILDITPDEPAEPKPVMSEAEIEDTFKALLD